MLFAATRHARGALTLVCVQPKTGNIAIQGLHEEVAPVSTREQALLQVVYQWCCLPSRSPGALR